MQAVALISVIVVEDLLNIDSVWAVNSITLGLKIR